MLFISYSTRDRSIAAEIYGRLTDRGYQLPFLDYHPDAGIPGGSKWEEELRWQLKVARGLVILCSSNWQESKWCFAELDRAKEFDKAIIPLNLDQMELPATISSYQGIPFHSRDDEAYERLWGTLEQQGLLPGDDFYWPRNECPYPGLAAFQEEHAGVYFGRDEELREFFENGLGSMRQNGDPRLIYVIGPSGSGKSSFVRAGVIPRLRFKSKDAWQIITVFRWAELKADGKRWGERLAGDVQHLYGDHPGRPDWDAEHRAKRYAIGDTPDSIGDAARRFVLDVKDLIAAVARENATPLIVLDQFEELLLADPDARGRTAFLQFLRGCLTADDSPCRAIATVRSDFLPAIQEHPELIAWNEHTKLFPLDLLKNERLFDIVRRPVELVDVRFESDVLVNRIVDEAKTSDALPLLAFTLKQFYDTCAQDRLLTVEEYDTKLGGLSKCLQRVAELVLVDEDRPDKRVDPVVENALRICFVKHLVQYEEGRAKTDDMPFVRQTAGWSDLPVEAHPLLWKMASDRFRLVRIDTRDDGTATVEVTHEALLRRWSTLAGWLNARRDLLRWRSDVKRSREMAAANNQTWGGLTNAQRIVARDWPTTRGEELSGEEIQWIQNANFKVRAWWASVAAAFVLVLALAGWAWYLKTTADALAVSEGKARTSAEDAQETAEAERERAQDNLYLSDMKLAEQSLRGGHREDLMRYLERWQPQGEVKDRRAFEWYHLRARARARLVSLAARDGPISVVAYSPAADLLASGGGQRDGVVQVWRVSSQALVFTAYPNEHLSPALGFAPVSSLAFSRDGKQLAAGFGHGAVTIWDLESKAILARREVGASVTCLAFGGSEASLLAIGTEVQRHLSGPFIGVWAWGAADDTESLWQNGSMRLQIRVEMRESIKAIGLHTSGERGTLVFENGHIRDFTVNRDGKRELSIPRDEFAGNANSVSAATFVAETNRLYFADEQGIHRVTIGEQGNSETTDFTELGTIYQMVPSPDETEVLVKDEHGFARGPWGSGKIYEKLAASELQGEESAFTTACFASRNDHEQIAWGEFSGRLVLRNPDSKSAVVDLPGTDGESVDRAIWSPDGRAVAIMTTYHEVTDRPQVPQIPPAMWRLTIHDSLTGDALLRRDGLSDESALRVAMSNEHVVVNTGNGLTWKGFRSRDDWKPLVTETQFQEIAISPDSRQLFGVPDRRLAETEGYPIEVWSLQTGEKMATLSMDSQGHRIIGEKICLAVSPDGDRLAAAWHNAVRVWDVPEGNVKQSIEIEDFASRLFVSAEHLTCFMPQRGVRRVNLSDNSVDFDAALPKYLAGNPRLVAVYPDASRLALAVMPEKIRLIDPEGQEVVSLDAMIGVVNHLGFSPDGQNLIAVYKETGVRIWRAPRNDTTEETTSQ